MRKRGSKTKKIASYVVKKKIQFSQKMLGNTNII